MVDVCLSNQDVAYSYVDSRFISACIIFCLISVTSTTLVQMRVVKETANYGYFGNNLADTETSNRLVASVPPSNFSGPQLLTKLVGKCYNLTQNGYRYTFCPFQNFTQYEVSPKWDAYQGILGIWSHWEVENNTFSAMLHKNGDSCGDIERSVKVLVACGLNETLLNMREPSRCKYEGEFQTRYACHPDAMLVYPRLDQALRNKWDLLYTELHNGDITEKGYKAGLQEILQEAGLAGNPTTKASTESTTPTSTVNGDGGTFVDLVSCNKEYKNLQNEISKLHTELEALKLLMDLSKIENRTHKPQSRHGLMEGRSSLLPAKFGK